jgi:hypothetical protein
MSKYRVVLVLCNVKVCKKIKFSKAMFIETGRTIEIYGTCKEQLSMSRFIGINLTTVLIHPFH